MRLASTAITGPHPLPFTYLLMHNSNKKLKCIIRFDNNFLVFQKSLKKYETLTDLKLTIDGIIIMSLVTSSSLRKSLDAMYDARIPEKW